jgi:cell division protein FtsW
MKKDKNEKENLPVESEKKNNAITEKVKDIGKRIDEWRLERNVVFSEPLTPKAPQDETAPLKKGGIDTWFLLWAMLLVCLGAVMSYSASAVYADMRHGDSTHYLWRYIIFAVLASVITAFFVMFARPWHWRIFGVAVYSVALIMLVLVLLIGAAEGVAQRWLYIGPISIQPSEIAKVAVVMMLALYMSKYEDKIGRVGKFTGSFKHGFLMPMIIIGLVCGLIALERHISGLMIVGIIGMAVMFLGGTRMKYLAAFLGLIAFAGIFLIAVSGYAQERVMSWINLEDDPLGGGWQTLQGLMAIGSGGILGLGYGRSVLKYCYVSEPANDMIFAILCEELGFVGALAVILLFGLLVWRGFRIASKAPDKFTSIVAYALMTKVALQAILNIAVVTNSIPNTGISLPFFSSGGTSLILQIFEMGIVLSISRFSRQKK